MSERTQENRLGELIESVSEAIEMQQEILDGIRRSLELYRSFLERELSKDHYSGINDQPQPPSEKQL